MNNVCPTCGQKGFKDESGVKAHHKLVHGESLVDDEFTCSYCGESTTSRNFDAERHFCDENCHANWKSENLKGENNYRWEGGKVSVSCSWCDTEKKVDPHRDREQDHFFCDSECNSKWLAENFSGDEHPQYNRKKVDCWNCGDSKLVTLGEYENKQRFYCSRNCQFIWQSENLSGENSHAWKGGLSFQPYPPNFNEELKEEIRERDNRICQKCGVHESELDRKISVHHIDYVKKNTNKVNLIALCHTCNSEVNGNRFFWMGVFRLKMNKKLYDIYYICQKKNNSNVLVVGNNSQTKKNMRNI